MALARGKAKSAPSSQAAVGQPCPRSVPAPFRFATPRFAFGSLPAAAPRALLASLTLGNYGAPNAVLFKSESKT